MSRYLIAPFVLACLTACTHPVTPPTPPATPQAKVAAPEAVSPPSEAVPLPPIDFAGHGLADAGCFLLRDLSTGVEQVSSSERCARARRPNSTFKIPNALIGADLGLLASPDTIMQWDAVRYPKQTGWPEGWDRDQTLREAMRISAVPLFQKLATDIGPERMAAYLERFDYGNRDMSAGLDRFWLVGGLRITAGQQVDLIAKLVRDGLPVSKQAHAIVRDVLSKDPIIGARHGGKTGTGRLEDPDGTSPEGTMVGWMVGWIELARGPVVYAMWVEAPSFEAVRELRTKTVDGVLGEVVRSWQ